MKADEIIEKVLTKYGEIFVDDIRNNLEAAGKVATGNLLNSITYDVTKEGTVTTLTVYGLEYIKYIDAGRTAGLKPPPKEAILKWIITRNIQPRKLPHGKRALPKDQERLAFVMARSIGKKGIKAKHVLSDPLKEIKQPLIAELVNNIGTALRQDIIDSFIAEIKAVKIN